MVFFVFLLDFRTVPTVWYFLFFLLDFRTLSDCVVFFVFLLDFRTVPTVWYFNFFIYFLLMIVFFLII